MNITPRQSAVVLLIATCILLAPGPATKPTSQPVMKSMAEDLIHYLPPPDPWVFKDVKKPDMDYYQNPKGDIAIQAIYAPRDFVLSSDTDASTAAGIVQTMREAHQKKKDEMVLGPRIVIDKRFDIVIHEKFKISKEVAEDQLHLYKSVGPRVMMVTVASLTDDEKAIDAAQKVAEDLLVSCKFNRKAFKKSN